MERGGRFLKKSDTKCTCEGRRGEEIKKLKTTRERKRESDAEEVEAGLESVMRYVGTGTAVK